MRPKMIRKTCLWAMLSLSIACAQSEDRLSCKNDIEAEHPGQITNAVVFWSAVADNSIVTVGGKSPQQGSIETAMVQTAVYDAVNAICGYPYTAYAVKPEVQVPALTEAAVASAAHDVLASLYPAQAPALDQQLADYLGAIPGHTRAKLNGIHVGQQTAAGIVELRADDGRDSGPGWIPPPAGPGIWQPTPPGFLPPATPWIRAVTPWTMTSPSQFQAPPPPTLDSDVWLHDYAESKAYGGATGSLRTPAQTDLAEFVGGPGVHPMLQWHGTWRSIASDQKLSVLEAARLFAMLSTVSSDALIGCWDSKYHYAFWRPVTAIRAGGGNPALTADPTWIGVVITPNHPEYPAAHGCFSSSVVEVLRSYFHSDRLNFTMSSPAPGLLQPVRSYDRFSQVLTDILDARVYGGMHYRNSTIVGAELGRKVARQALDHYFVPSQDDWRFKK